MQRHSCEKESTIMVQQIGVCGQYQRLWSYWLVIESWGKISILEKLTKKIPIIGSSGLSWTTPKDINTGESFSEIFNK